MSKRILLISLLILGFIFLTSAVFAQALPSGYDEDDEVQFETTNEEGAGTTFIQDLEVIRRTRINDIINKIREGDPNVLRFVVYDVLEEVHTEVIRRARAYNSNFYEVLNMAEAIDSYVGGFDNQDPKVRLRCIGWLGDWVDEIGLHLDELRDRASDRLASRIETREEVKFGLRLLRLKIVRKIALNKIYKGDEGELATISADDFIGLIHNELFLRVVWCIPRRVKIRSIRLAPWWINMRALDAIVAQRLLLTRRLDEQSYNAMYTCYSEDADFIYTDRTGNSILMTDLMALEDEESRKMRDPMNVLPLLPTGYDVYRLKTLDDPLQDGREFETLKTYYFSNAGAGTGTGLADNHQYYHGYKDHAGRWDIQSLYDLRYFNYSESGEEFPNEEEIFKALFGGLKNRHLVVRENVARIMIMMTDPYVKKDMTNTVIGVDGVLDDLRKQTKYINIATDAWKDVQYAQFIDVARPAIYRDRYLNKFGARIGANPITLTDPTNNTFLSDPVVYSIDGSQIHYAGRYSASLGGGFNPWGYCWNYRIDIHELLRRMGLGQLFDCEEDYTPPTTTVTVTRENTYFVESLFDLTELDVVDQDNSIWDLIPSWHGVDEIEDEIFYAGQ